MKFGILNDDLVDLYEKHGLDEDHEQLFETLIQTRGNYVNPAHFVRDIQLSKLYETVMSETGGNNEQIGAPIGAKDYLEILREKMTLHALDHSRSIDAIDRLIPSTSSTLDNINNGLMGVYLGQKPQNSRPLSLDDPEACASALEDFDSRNYEPRILKFLGRFNVEWPTPHIEVEPIPPEDEMEADISFKSPEL